MATRDQLGERTVALVHDVFMLAILRELQSAPAHAKDISKHTDGVSVAGVKRGFGGWPATSSWSRSTRRDAESRRAFGRLEAPCTK